MNSTIQALPLGTVRSVTPEENHFYEEHGWVKIERLIAPEFAAELLAAAQGLMGQSGDQHVERQGIDNISEWWNDRHFLAREGFEPFRSFAFSKEMGRNAQTLIGRKVAVRHWSDLIAIKSPSTSLRKSAPTDFHQDYPNAQFDRPGVCTFWIALHEMPPEQATMRFFSGSHRLGPLGKHPQATAGNPENLIEANPVVRETCPMSPPLHLRPGDATCHHMHLVHGAPANTTPEPRWSYNTIYLPNDTLFTGTTFSRKADGLERGKPFDHSDHPVVYP